MDFIMDQLSELGDVSYRAMMGEYVIYYRGKVVAGVYDDQFLVKPTSGAKALLPNAPTEIPYPGGKPMIMIEDIKNRNLNCHSIGHIIRIKSPCINFLNLLYCHRDKGESSINHCIPAGIRI